MKDISIKFFSQYKLRDTFEDSSFSGWASYPSVQDYGYNPFISPKKEIYQGKEKNVLWCQKETYYPGIVRLGFIKKVNFWLNSDCSVKFRFHLKSYEPVKQIRFCFVSVNGNYIESVQKKPVKDSWQTFSFYLKDKVTKNKPVQILSVFIEAEIQGQYSDEVYELKIDDVYIKALRPYEPILSEPEYEEHPQYGEAYIVKTYLPEDTLRIIIDVPKNIRSLISKLLVKLIPSNGKTLFQGELLYSGKPLKKEINVFNKGKPGIWKLQISAKDKAGNVVISKKYDILQLPIEIEIKKSPFLYFYEKDREIFKQYFKNKEIDTIYKYLKKCADKTREKVFIKNKTDIEKLDDNFFLFSAGRYFELIEPVSEMVQLNSFIYYLDKKEEALKAVKSTLLTMSSWKKFNHPWIEKHGQFIYYPTGEVSQKLAFAYDIISSELTLNERKKIAQFFIDKIIIPAYKEYYLHDRIPAKSSNWEAHVLSGAILCGLAILNDVKKEKFINYIIALIQTLRRYLEKYLLNDGSSAESTGYLGMTFNSLSSVIPALKRTLNIDFFKKCSMGKSLLYLTYLSKLKYSYMQIDYGDSGPSNNWSSLAYYAKITKNQLINFLYKNYKGKNISDIIWHNPNQNISSIKDLPLNAIFSKKGVLVSRSSWDEDCLFLSFKCGPFFNHAHADNGSFFLYFKKDLLIDEAGTSPGGKHYYYDPYFNSYYTQGIGHNTLLVNDNPISQKFSEWPTENLGLKKFPKFNSYLFSDNLNFITGDLNSVYDELENYERSILYLKPDIFFIIDRVKHNDHKAESYSQIFHAGELTKSVIENNKIKIVGENSGLWLNPIYPDNMIIKKKRGHIPLRDYGGTYYGEISALNDFNERYYFQITTPDKRAENLLITHMNVFSKDSKKDYIPWEKISLKNCISLKKIAGGSQVQLYFLSPKGSKIKDLNIDSDAEILGVFKNPDNQIVQEIFINKGAYLIYQGIRWFECKETITGLFEYNKLSTKLKLFLLDNTEIKIYFSSEPKKIEIDGRKVSSKDFLWIKESNQICLKLRKGLQSIVFR